jgi:hypothetical protein
MSNSPASTFQNAALLAPRQDPIFTESQDEVVADGSVDTIEPRAILTLAVERKLVAQITPRPSVAALGTRQG